MADVSSSSAYGGARVPAGTDTAAMPQPAIDVWNKPFWDACAEGRLIVQRCKATGKTWWPPSPVSPFDLRAGWEWIDSAGKGTVMSWVVFHQKYFAGFADRLPYNVAIVRMDEGFSIQSNIAAPNDGIHIGQRVSLAFEKRGNANVPIFVPAEEE
ncbi:OB-fold domain-containing protein [Pigmentiphaga soli]|uniref:OB-fold domain-containing protein n=1 Tax=Pigmentiphaga soli TaxID=1007095 RepID=A0ABP8H9C8_9BURK